MHFEEVYGLRRGENFYFVVRIGDKRKRQDRIHEEVSRGVDNEREGFKWGRF